MPSNDRTSEPGALVDDIGDSAAVLIDLASDGIVGLQLEGFLSATIVQEPRYRDLLDGADGQRPDRGGDGASLRAATSRQYQ